MDDYYKNLPKKRMGAGILLFNENGDLLIVKPSYKEYWSIPGGVVNENESPRQACIREIKEEIGLKISSINLLCVDYISGADGKGENLQFIFYGGTLNKEGVEQIQIDQKEISEHKFTNIREAVKLFGKGRKLAIRLEACLAAVKNKTVIYLENGRFAD